MEENIKQYKADVKKVREKRKSKITGSLGVYDAYKWLRKNKWLGLNKPITEHQFYTVIRRINRYLTEEFLKGKDIVFPYGMGKITSLKTKPRISFVDGKLKTNLPIDWDRTLELWCTDKKAREKHSLVYLENKYIVYVKYDKSNATYINKSFIKFKVNRDLHCEVKYRINIGKLDAFTLDYDLYNN